MDRYLCLTIRSRAGESEAAFKTRLAGFWTYMIRSKPDDYEKVYSESVKFEREEAALLRQYMFEIEALTVLNEALQLNGIEFDEVDESDTYNTAEASSSEWFQIPHD